MAAIEIVADFARDLLDTADTYLSAFDRDPVDNKFLAAGVEAPWDIDRCGQLSVTLSMLRASEDFPIPMATTPIRCAPPWMMASYTVELVRCWPTLDDNGNPPDDGLVTTAAAGIMTDLTVLWNAVVCSAARYNTDSDVLTTLQDGMLVGPNGGSIGAQIHAVLGISDPCPCAGTEYEDPGNLI